MNTVRTPNLQKSISAKLSTSRFLTQTLGFGKGLIPDIKKKKYNKRYRNKVHTIVEMSKMNNNSNMMQIKSERISEIQKSLKSKGFYQFNQRKCKTNKRKVFRNGYKCQKTYVYK